MATSADGRPEISPEAESLLGYFDQQVLAAYRNESDKYLLETDSFEGMLTTRGGDGEYFRIRFGYRTLLSGELAIAALLPDLDDAIGQQQRWFGFLLTDPVWREETDNRFEMWVKRYLEGSWNVDNGPLFQLSEVVKTINALTSEILGVQLYKFTLPGSVSFPAAENTHAYQDSHRELYGYLVDGIDKECLEVLCKHAGTSVNFSSRRPLKAITDSLPSLKSSDHFKAAMDLVSGQRGLASHGVRAAASRIAAFDQFTRDLQACVGGLEEVLKALETLLQVTGESARRRVEAKSHIPQVQHLDANLSDLKNTARMVGKTIRKVEIGERQRWENVHGSELITIEFDDGTLLSIDTGSNAGNLCAAGSIRTPDQFHVDYLLFWVPPLQKIIVSE